MAPTGKRKRGDRNYSYDEDHSPRPSPHRPQNLNLASPQQTNSPRGGRRGSRNSGRGGYSNVHNQSATHASPTAMSPPANTHQPSRPAPPTPSSPALPKEPVVQPSPREAPETNDYLTPARVHNWNAEARNAVVQAAITAQRDGDIFNLNIAFLEIIHASMESLMEPAELGSIVRDIVAAPADELVDPVSCFLDCLNSYSEITVDKQTKQPKPHPSIKPLLVATEIDPDRMRRELDDLLLIGVDLVRVNFTKIGIRKTTNILYRQMNYNLLREETEGYSKLMTEYFTTVNSEPPRHDVVSETFQRVNALIGTFDLDVGRVLDVTLDVFANLLVKHNRFFIKYLRASTWWPKQLGADNVEWQEPEVKTLPNWALPKSHYWYYTDEEKAEQLRLRESRDVKFWQRMTEIIDKEGKHGKNVQAGERASVQAFFELGARPVIRTARDVDKTDAEDTSKAMKKTAAQEWADQWIADTATLPPLGNEVAAQLLGFKLQFYASDSRDAHDVLPDNLIYLAALLIKIGFISITDLWSHLYPQGQDMESIRAKLKAEQAEKEAKRKGKTANALTMAGALSDDMPSVPAVSRLREAESKPSSKQESERSTPVKSDEESKPVLPEPADQKVALLRSLLCIGAIPEALFIIGRHKWFLELYPDLHAYIFRLAHHSLSKVYESSRPVPLEQVPATTKGSTGNSTARASDYAPRRTLRWAKPDLKDAGDGIDYRFYWEDWVDNVPICQTVDDVFLLCHSLLGLIGPECGRDIVLLTKLARIGKKSIIDDSSETNMRRWSDLSATFLVPALTFTGQNPGVVNEVWELLNRFDVATRYTIYHQWDNSMKPAMRTAFEEVKSKTNHLLNRVANTNTKPMGRAIAKLANACPVKVFKQTLDRGQQYMNMIHALVECSRYLTQLGYDCLTYALVVSITSGNKPAQQSDGMLTEGWLKNTANFVAKVYHRYGRMDPTPILEFISFQLLNRNGELFVMKVLEELITVIGGVSLSGALKEESVVALSSGPRLRAYTLDKLGDQRHKVKKAAADRLLDYFKKSSLAPPILIALADQVQTYLYRNRKPFNQAPDKVALFNYDSLKLNFFQFLEYLREYLTTVEFDEQIPGLVELVSDYDLDTEFAFHISRDSIATKANAIRLQRGQVIADALISGDVIMDEPPKAEHDPVNAENVSAVVAENAQDVKMGNTTSTDESDPISGPQHKVNAQGDAVATPKSNAEIDTLVAQLRSSLPAKFGKYSCLNFLVTFWQLSLRDVQEPDGHMIKQQYEDAKQRIIANASSTGDRRKEMVAIRYAREEAEKFSGEYGVFIKQAQLIQSSLREEMHFWFPAVPSMDSALHMTLLQDCFLPRARMSLHDAQFSSSMLFFMHKSRVPKFRLIKILDELFNTGRLSAIFFSMSEDESKNVGRFMNDILQELGRWHNNEDVYNTFACGKIFNDEGQPTSFLTYLEFRALLGKWHNKIHDALHECMRYVDQEEKQTLENTARYTELRNSINILKAVAPSFPRTHEIANRLEEDIKHYAEKEERQDIQVAANSLRYEFKRNAKHLRSHSMFVTGKEDPKEATPEPSSLSKTKSSSLNTLEVRDHGSKTLSASAQPFQPKASATNGVAKSMGEKSGFDEQKPHTTASNTATPTSRVNGHDSIKSLPRTADQGASQQSSGRDTTKRLGTGPSLTSVNSTPVPPRPDSRDQIRNLSGRGRMNVPVTVQLSIRRTMDATIFEQMVPMNMDVLKELEVHCEVALRRLGVIPALDLKKGQSALEIVQSGLDESLANMTIVLYAYHLEMYVAHPIGAHNMERIFGTIEIIEMDVINEIIEKGSPCASELIVEDPHNCHTPQRTAGAASMLLLLWLQTILLPIDEILLVNTVIAVLFPHRAAIIEEHVNSERATFMKDDRVNPERAAFLPDDRSRNTARLDRDGRESRNPFAKEVDRDVRNPFAKEAERHGRDPRSTFAEEGDRHGRDSRNPFAKEERVRNPDGRPERDIRSDDRDVRRDRLQSPRRDERPNAPYYGNDTRRDYRDERSMPQAYPNTRERRDDMSGNAPTGPRGGRDGPNSSRVSRDMFQPSQSSRPAAPSQDPNYGRLNQPNESIPSGPKCEYKSFKNSSHLLISSDPSSDRRDIQTQPPAPTPPAAPAAAQPSGVHPSRMENFRGPPGPPGPTAPPLQTNIANAPSGPRGSGRTPLPSPSSRGPPTGPAFTDRNLRRQDSRTALGAINNVLAQTQAPNAPPAPAPERSAERGHRRRERSRSGERKPDDRAREKRDGSRRDRERESSHRDRSDRRDDRRKDDRDRDRSEKKRSRDPIEQPHGETKRSRR
ncbi:THO2 plays a role in transcriptional elongation [Kalmusia sp. IMI 367209]|nr:THO2 plays a role in transcriptional elongation [Kalmusia sp. IMI 367209]